MAIIFDDNEIKILSKCPYALRTIAIWRDVQQNRADDQGVGCNGDGIRAKELRAEADKIESEY